MELAESKASLIHNEIGSRVSQYVPKPYSKIIQRVSLSWKAVNVFVPVERGSVCKRMCGWCGLQENDEARIKQILCDVSGKVEPGTLLAVMGASGSGKSTLMNVLAHRNIASVQVTGTVMVNGRSLGLDINSISAYVQQEDLFIGKLTVREHLTFQAHLRMEKHFSRQERMQTVENVLNELGLMKCADTPIGIPGRLHGISGGEKKKLSFASEVLTDPSILFADEPTSGLDSFMAQNMMSTLQNLASQGRTVMCIIHQPSSEVYAMFTTILLMAEGRVAYLGPATEAIPYFAKLGYSCPAHFNPADYFVHMLAVVPGQESQCRKRVKEICDTYAKYDMMKDEQSHLEDPFKDDEVVLPSPYKASWCKQFSALLWRSWLSTNRGRIVFQIRVIERIVIGLIVGLIFFHTTINVTGIQNIAGALFFLVTTVSFSTLSAVTHVFPTELPVFIREHKNGIYRTDVYFICKTLAEMPVFLLLPFVLAATAYWMIGLREDIVKFVLCYAILALISNVAASFGYIISTLVSTVQTATAIGAPVMLPLLLLGGFFVKNSLSKPVPVYLIWVKYLSWFQYGFELLNINQWHNYGKIEDCPQFLASSNQTGDVCIPNGEAALKFLGFDEDNMLTDVFALFALLVGFRIVAFLLLLRRARKKQ